MKTRSNKAGCFALSLLTVAVSQAVHAAEPVASESATTLPEVVVTYGAVIQPKSYWLPQTIETTTAQKIMETVNVVDTQDAVKYMPSLFIRKRNYGDTSSVMATRTWGVGSSARSLIYADGVLLSALIGNNNGNASPRWGMVAPEEIERIDVMYGPFSAAYSGNSMGAVVEMTTRMPKKFEATVSQTFANQSYDQYSTHKSLLTSQTSALVGDRVNDFAYWVSVNHQDSNSHPIAWVTNATQPAGTVGGFPTEKNKLGVTTGVFGAGALLHTVMDNFKIKAAYDISPTVTANYTFGYWSNNANASVESYLTTIAGVPTYGGLAGFASGTYNLDQQHSMHSLSAKSNTQGAFDWEAVASLYGMDKDRQNTPTSSVAGTTNFNPAGRIAVQEGTGWSTLDLKGIWRPDGKLGAHEVSFGAHNNAEQFSSVTFNTANWLTDITTTTFTSAKGKTTTNAFWLQDAWKFAPSLKATLGGRYEQWKAMDGYNFSGTTALNQAARDASSFSPKASLAWGANDDWLVTSSLGKATRYPTVGELYQLVVVGATTTNPNLRPEQVLSGEIAFERGLDDGKLRISLFQEDVKDALISQTNTVTGVATPVTFITNVDKIRNRGVELAFQQNHVIVNPLEIQGSLTYVDGRILADAGWMPPAAQAGVPVVNSVVGLRAPSIPDWRATLRATWRSNEKLSTTLGMRYSGKQYSTLDNTDVVSNVYGAFDSFFVADVRAQYKFDKNWVGTLGIDNLLNKKYTLFHPFPQRTVVGTLKYTY